MNVTDISSYASASSAAQTTSAMGIAVARRAQDQQRLEGQAALQLMQSAAQVQASGLPRGDGTGTVVDELVC